MMTRSFTLFAVLALTLAACSSSSRHVVTRVASPTAAQFATGPIYAACRASDRRQASRARCGCVQAVANRELSTGDQRRGAAFFRDPHQAQVVRQSDRPADERFWQAWRAYSNSAARTCG